MLTVNETARVDASLAVGNVTEAITVEGRSGDVNTATADLSKTVDAAAIQSLPLVDRNVYSLLDLTPGVQSNNNGVASASSGTNSLILGFPEQRTLINGGADGGTGSVNYYLDGGINMTALRNTGNILPNPDAIQEFKVQTDRLQRGIRPLFQRRHQRHHQGGHEPRQRLGIRVPPGWEDEREGLGRGPCDAAAEAQSVRRNTWRSAAARQDVLLRHLLGPAADDQYVPEYGHRADTTGADGGLQPIAHAAQRIPRRARPSRATASSG